MGVEVLLVVVGSAPAVLRRNQGVLCDVDQHEAAADLRSDCVRAQGITQQRFGHPGEMVAR
jgi:hypothetical protein